MTKAERLTLGFIITVLNDLYGYDFKHYSKASLKRRLYHHQRKAGLDSLADLLASLINSPASFNELLCDLSVTVTDMFRDPSFYRAFKQIVIPRLKTYPYAKIWHAGCASGEEVYSMAILLHESNFLARSLLYGTDFNNEALAIAKKGIYPVHDFIKHSNNYAKVSGAYNLEAYVTQKYESFKIKQFLQDKISFFHHNLVTDGAFGQMEVIVCRNVLIYFEDCLRDSVLELFHESLRPNGYLCLGEQEKLSLSSVSEQFKCIDKQSSIYQRIDS